MIGWPGREKIKSFVFVSRRKETTIGYLRSILLVVGNLGVWGTSDLMKNLPTTLKEHCYFLWVVQLFFFSFSFANNMLGNRVLCYSYITLLHGFIYNFISYSWHISGNLCTSSRAQNFKFVFLLFLCCRKFKTYKCNKVAEAETMHDTLILSWFNDAGKMM